jgi:hypothetical protein
MAIRAEDRPIVIAVATQMWCARIQAMEGKRVNGEMKWGYSPDVELCVGEAAALIQRVDEHIAPKQRKGAIEERRRNRPAAVTLNLHASKL